MYVRKLCRLSLEECGDLGIVVAIDYLILKTLKCGLFTPSNLSSICSSQSRLVAFQDQWINCYCSAQIVPNSSMSVYKVFWLLTLWQFEIWYKNFFVCLVRKSWRHLWPNCVWSSSTDSNFKYFLFGWWMIDRTSLSQYYILWVWTLKGFWRCHFPHTPNKLGNF